jgi:hypothetical protein
MLASFSSIGVPVNPMNDARGKPSRMCPAKGRPESRTGCVASSAITTMLRLGRISSGAVAAASAGRG